MPAEPVFILELDEALTTALASGRCPPQVQDACRRMTDWTFDDLRRNAAKPMTDAHGRPMTTPKTMPRQAPGTSRQDYGTPAVFLDAVKRRLGIRDFAIDLAATAENAVCPCFWSEHDDALTQTWASPGVAWLNPPFARIAPWVARARHQAQGGARIAMLVPAAVGSNWWARFVHQKACVLFLNGRLTFVGETQPYVKDCALLLYGPDVAPTYIVWRWPQVAKAEAA